MLTMSTTELTAQMMAALDRFADCLRDELHQRPERDDRSALLELLQFLEMLKASVRAQNTDLIGTASARIRRAIDDGAFVTSAPLRAYVPFERIFQRWRTQVLYAAENDQGLRSKTGARPS